MASRSNIAPSFSQSRGVGDTTTIIGGNHQSILPVHINDSNELIQVSDGGIMQVSFNLGNHMVNGQEEDIMNSNQRITSAAVQRDLSFNVLTH